LLSKLKPPYQPAGTKKNENISIISGSKKAVEIDNNCAEGAHETYTEEFNEVRSLYESFVSPHYPSGGT
jgi:hypothetical protein